MKVLSNKKSSRLGLTNDWFSFGWLGKSLCEFDQTHRPVSSNFLFLCLCLYSVKIVNGPFSAIGLNGFAFTMHFIIFPVNFKPATILYQYSESILFVLEKLSFINCHQRLFPAKPMLSILFPVSNIFVSSGLILINTITVSCVISPLAIIDRARFILSHSNEVSRAFAIKANILRSVLKDTSLKFKILKIVHSHR